MEEFWKDLYIELIKTSLALLLLVASWGIGQRILAFWDLRKKRQELDVATVADFQRTYGEIKEISRIWRIYIRKPEKNIYPEYTQWEILQRAVSAESKIEGIIVKLATERNLSEAELMTIGLFRQCFQKVREDIRDESPLVFIADGPGYTLFNDLACRVAYIISSGRHSDSLTSEQARMNLRTIASIGSKILLKEAEKAEYQVGKFLTANEEQNTSAN